jgi:hypothetical protein
VSADDRQGARVFSCTLALALLLGLLIGVGAATGVLPGLQAPGDSAGADAVERLAAPESSVSIRFAIEVDPDAAGPVYVVLTDEGSQLGWVQAFRGAERVYLHERCEIANCGEAPAVCGMAIRTIRNITGTAGGRSIEHVWDGTTSLVDPSSRCEKRVPALPGEYRARFCYSREARVNPGGDPDRAAAGGLIEPTCVDLPFSLGDAQVVLKI